MAKNNNHLIGKEIKMKQIQVDEDVFDYIKRESTWEDGNPNGTLRRLFGVKKTPEIRSVKSVVKRTVTSKEKKADLPTMIRFGMLHEGQSLKFRYREPLANEYSAKVSGNGLNWKGEHYSMSRLVAVILKIEGHDISSGSYRGPAYWYTAEGKSIKDLWEINLLD